MAPCCHGKCQIYTTSGMFISSNRPDSLTGLSHAIGVLPSLNKVLQNGFSGSAPFAFRLLPFFRPHITYEQIVWGACLKLGVKVMSLLFVRSCINDTHITLHDISYYHVYQHCFMSMKFKDQWFRKRVLWYFFYEWNPNSKEGAFL